MKNIKNEGPEDMKVGEIRETPIGKMRCISFDNSENDCHRCSCYIDGCSVEFCGCGECRGYYREDGVEVVFELG